MEGLKIKGTVIQILPVMTGQSKAGKDWSKQEFVIETEDQFPKKVCFTLFGDKTALINGVSEGDNVDVAFNLESREFNERWYHNINAWRIDKDDSESKEYSPDESTSQFETDTDKQTANDTPEDDLPF